MGSEDPERNKFKSPPLPGAGRTLNVPISARLSHEIPKPKDWQAFQRQCVILFRCELRDPNTKEYGRNGQKQNGIDILGRRNADPDHLVGIQCRRYNDPITKNAILTDCRATLGLPKRLKELIFVTTAKDDKNASDIAIQAQEELRTEGIELSVEIYGWEALSILIAQHDAAYSAFCPAIHSSFATRSEVISESTGQRLSEQIDALLQTTRQPHALPSESDDLARKGEDASVHSKIDVYRDLFKQNRNVQVAEEGLRKLASTLDASSQPYAAYRIKANLASITLEKGDEAEAAHLYEEAYEQRPLYQHAVANLALARILQGKFDDAMKLARAALNASPRADEAVGYLLQAAARSDWSGEPESLIPQDLVRTENADLGLAEFYRIRSVPKWPERVIKICKEHQDNPLFRKLAALATLVLAAEGNVYLPGGTTPVAPECLLAASKDLKAEAEHQISVSSKGVRYVCATAVNAAVALRFCGNIDDALALLLHAREQGFSDDALIRTLGLMQALKGQRTNALATLATAPNDMEAQLLAVELLGEDDPKEALRRAIALSSSALSPLHVRTRLELIAELSLSTGDERVFEVAIQEMRSIRVPEALVQLLLVRKETKSGADVVGAKDRLEGVLSAITEDDDIITRVQVADGIRRLGSPYEASRLLEGRVDYARLSPALSLLLRSLAESRRDEAFRAALDKLPPNVRQHHSIIWMSAAHSWNVGDLSASLQSVGAYLQSRPDDFGARMLKLEILIRQNKSGEILTELEQPLEALPGAEFRDKLRLAVILNHFGFVERATDLAYRLFLEKKNEPQAWMVLSTIVLEDGFEGRKSNWSKTSVGPDAAVDIRYENGEEEFFVIEQNVDLRNLDAESWEPEHPLAKAATGCSPSQQFTCPDGRVATVVQVRHKYVARLHFVLAEYERRFPTVFGFRSISVDVTRPDGLEALRTQLKERHDWVEDAIAQYKSGNVPIPLLSAQLGQDPIETANALNSHGVPIRVALGVEQERVIAKQAIKQNAHAGCVVDLMTFWFAYRIEALEEIEAVLGPINVSQGVLDALQVQREKAQEWTSSGYKTMAWRAQGIHVVEVDSEYVRHRIKELDGAIKWLTSHAIVRAIVVTDDAPEALREYVQSGKSNLLDEVLLAYQSGLIFLSDDIAMRGVARALGVSKITWLQAALWYSAEIGRLDPKTYSIRVAQLIELGENYISISAPALTAALRIDLEEGRKAPGPVFSSLCKMLGGTNAELRSHIGVVWGLLSTIWNGDEFAEIRAPATSIILRSAIKLRHEDYPSIIVTLLQLAKQNDRLLFSYILSWVRGHFLTGILADPMPRKRRRQKRLVSKRQ